MLNKLVSLDRRWIFLAIGIAVALPFIAQWTLPPGKINPRTQSIYDKIDAAKSGETILICCDYGPSSMPELHPMALAVIKHALRKDLRVLVMTLHPQGTLMADDILNTISKDMPDKKDGEDFVNLGFKPGSYLVILGMGENIPKTFTTDAKSRPTATLPVMKGIRSLKDIYLAVELSASNLIFTWVLFGHEKFDLTLACGLTAVMATDVYPYLDTGQLIGALNGLKGAAEYEQLIQSPDKALLGMTSQSVAHLLIILFVILGNIGYFATRKRRGR